MIITGRRNCGLRKGGGGGRERERERERERGGGGEREREKRNSGRSVYIGKSG